MTVAIQCIQCERKCLFYYFKHNFADFQPALYCYSVCIFVNEQCSFVLCVTWTEKFTFFCQQEEMCWVMKEQCLSSRILVWSIDISTISMYCWQKSSWPKCLSEWSICKIHYTCFILGRQVLSSLMWFAKWFVISWSGSFWSLQTLLGTEIVKGI